MQQMVTCQNCGSQNAANQQFCVSCGAHLGGNQRQIPHMPIVTGIAAPGPLVTGMALPQQVVTPAVAPDTHHHRQLDVKPTWGLAWGLFWRMLCLWIFLSGAIFLGYMLVRLALGYTSVFGSW
jgi:hypothetical protein